uniref:Uncharacterized protein n=1 Tax=Anopheles albimanus TaxID=7167 RepID=A0A182FHC2_ANOAL
MINACLECQNLIEENRRLMNLAASASAVGSGGGAMYAISSGMLLHGGSGSGSLSTLGMGIPNGAGGGGSGGNGSYTNVESVILQTQVETLQWQLKQVDSSRHMYRAVMEEVVRFLDRCYRSLDALQAAGQIGRSKSVLQVSGANGVTANGGSKAAGQQHHGTTINHNHHHHNHHHHDSDSSSASSPRARSSTNLIEGPKAYTKASMSGGNGRLEQQQQQQSLSLINASGVAPTALHEDDCNVPPSPASSYSTFRDFTWRRSPKRTQTLPISSNEVDPEKLAQEAFRLLRTVQNLLNTQEPTLAQSTNALDSLISSTAASSCGSSTTLTGVGLSTSGNGITGGGSGSVLGSSMPTLTGINGAGAGGAPTAGAAAAAAAAASTVHTVNGAGGTGGGGGLAGSGLVNTRSTVGFSRKLNMRGSRLSVRSSTADSVHSTSSSAKTETDEDSTDRPSPPLLLSHQHHHHHHLLLQHQNQMANGGHGGAGGGGAGPGSIVGGPIGGSSSSTSSTSSNSSSCSSSTTSGNGHHHHHNHHTNRYSANIERIKEMMISSSAEDESGFSSMNSFQEIGLPLINSTMISSIGSVDSAGHHGAVGSSASSADGAGSNNSGSGVEGGTDSTGSGAASGGGGGGGGTGTGSNSGPFGMSDDSSVLRENTVIPTNAGSTVISSNSANRLGIPSSPARTTVSTTGSTSSIHSPATTTSSSTNVTTGSNGPTVNGSPLRATQNSSYEHHTHFVNHRRWDSAPVVPPKLKIHTGETDTVSRVLWV